MAISTLPTAFTKTFGLSVPIVQAPMGGVAGPMLVASAANVGALAILPIWTGTPATAQDLILKTQSLTTNAFAVNLRADLNQQEHIAVALSSGVSVLHLFWGNPARSMPAIRRAGARMIATVSDVDSTKAALDAGASALIAQGVEAGGHVFGTKPLDELVPLVIAEAAGVPVAAAGGIVDSDGVMRTFRQGASAAVLGTCLVATDESDAHPDYKKALVDACSGDTVLSNCFDGFWPDAPHRTLKNSTFRAWQEAGYPDVGARPGEGDIVMRIPGLFDIPRYHAATPTARMTGTCEAMALYAGTGVGSVRRVHSAASLIQEIVSAAAAQQLR